VINVVIADDDVNVRRGLEKLVNWDELGARLVLVCKSGKEVAEYLKNHRVDFIISDVKMPGMDGLELSQHVSKVSPDTVVVLLSAYNEFDLVQEALQNGVQKYILKPINKEKLKLLSDMIKDVSEEKRQKKKLSALIYNSDFRNVIKTAFRENDVSVVSSMLSLSKHIDTPKRSIIKDYYTFLFNILAEFAREVVSDHHFEENLFYELNRCITEEEYKRFLLGIYEQIMSLNSFVETRKEKVSVQEIKNYIDRHYGEYGFSTNDIVKRFNFSVSYLSSLFKKNEGTTIVDYITEKRIQRATQLIRETDLSITYISSLVGYDNIQYFSKVFKSVMKMSPTDYSNEYRNGGRKQ